VHLSNTDHINANEVQLFMFVFHPNSRQKPMAVTTVYIVPDDGRKGRPKHVEF